ncbi:peptide-N(4)-(N-acetyl-beta-glucosaminyl)asparagine amidase isoform X2 [Populus trichocarpa]|uniref:peptide-N(4)-(N-acetyl-beta- glucosaminyl)asparagine amidase isoform X2 n=1 Tax=Populus trichocarpa TaxID=3694 RepID=UPI002278AEE7|nr:peptide-N(4)-(N-acetyl-beta-glucosaminyl)asparagine amidase isoform X2 [Populus trichocarpa]
MVARQFIISHNDSIFDVDYDTDDGLEVLKIQLFSLTSIPPHLQQITGEDDDRVVSDDSDLTGISNKLKLIKINEEEKEVKLQESIAAVVGQQNEEESIRDILGGDDVSDDSDVVHVSNELKELTVADLMKSDEELAQMLQAEEEALMLQEFAVSEQSDEFGQKIRPYISQVQMYEDPVRQEAARKTVPREELEEKALVSLAKEGNFKPSKTEQDHAFLLQLLFWFKQSFRWVNEPPCDGCGNDTVNQGMDAALPSETQYGAARVELYRCNSCSTITRFPRYNDPLKLVETRRGRCGEWANCFTLYCRAFGYESRLILDFTDHVWTECFSELLGRWMHLDPCDGVFDRPLLYEKGWNKKLNYVIAIAKDGVYDVTKRYTRKWVEVLSRRNITREPDLLATLRSMTRECRRSFTTQILSVLEDRDKIESEELERSLCSTNDSSVSLPGRQSGNKEWRIARSEIGFHDNCCWSHTSCPIRVCVDEHVTKTYNAFSPLLSRCVDHSLPKSRIVEILKIFKGILVELGNSSYKTRRTSINPFILHLLPYFDELINALSLKSEIDTDGKVDICLAADPVITSLGLPVVLDALDDLINVLNNFDNISKVSLSWPLIKLNRIHSGSVLASGEELPFGIATSAFDGLRTSKWEEPDGARVPLVGCWIVYKLSDNQMHKLVAYDIMSANDAPERDPMDWVVEGSDDGGSSWRILDKRTSQMFKNRFQRKSFKINSDSVPCNTFRFQFLAARDVQSNSRLQLGSIDLYASSD